MITIIRQSDYAEVTLVVRAFPSADKRQPDRVGTAKDTIGFGRLLVASIRRMLVAIEHFLVGKPGLLPNASALVDGTALLAGIDVLTVAARRMRRCDCIDGDDLASIQARNLDVLVQLGFRRLKGGILRSARYGVWSYQHGDPRPNPSGTEGYWEVMQSSPVTESTLWMLTEVAEGGWVLYRSYSSTHDMSLADNLSNALWKALHFVPRSLKELYDEGEEEFLARVGKRNAPPLVRDERIYEAPANGEIAVLVWKKFLQKIRRKWRDKLHFWQWFLLYDIGDNVSTSLQRFKYLTPPKDRFWADPFVVARDNKYYLFIEELMYARGKGHISVIVMTKDGSFEGPVQVLEAPYHLSYPFIFEFDGIFYLIPESSGNRTIDLYKCTSFPFRWEFHKTLMKGCRAVDATLLHWKGRWWLFVNQVETEGASTWDELFLFYSDSPLSDNWTPHRRNPVVSDTRSARPAGRLFVRDGRLYRPSQNCSGHYGYGFNICEITHLTERDYRERVVTSVEPTWDRNVISTHTINHAGGLTIADGQMRRRR
jgi:hypothetical protein